MSNCSNDKPYVRVQTNAEHFLMLFVAFSRKCCRHSGVCWLRQVIRIEEKRRRPRSKETVEPGVFVGKAPKSDLAASRHGEAGGHDVPLLNGLSPFIAKPRYNIQLGDGHFKSESLPILHHRHQSLSRGCTYQEMMFLFLYWNHA